MQPLFRSVVGFLASPVVMAAFVTATSSLYSRVEWPATFLAMLSIAYSVTVVLGLPAFWLLRARKRQSLARFFTAGLVVGIAPAALLYAIVVEPVLALCALAGSALGGMFFWTVAVREGSSP